MHTKEEILSAIKRLAKSSGSSPGWRALQTSTGIRYAEWHGKYWSRWGEALEEAGLSSNELNPRRPDSELLRHCAELARDLGRVPTFGDMKLRKRTDPGFPDAKTYSRFGGKRNLIDALARWCADTRGFDDVSALLLTHTEEAALDEGPVPTMGAVQGHVYLIRSGRHHKIGRTNSAERRAKELAVQLPEKSTTVHVIETDDPAGIEAYWHRRFAEKRANGEWFKLSAEDVRAFRRRRYQ